MGRKFTKLSILALIVFSAVLISLLWQPANADPQSADGLDTDME